MNEPILEEYKCQICQNILENPIKLDTCNHIFCKKCINDTIDFIKENNENSSKNKKIDEYSCPLCRIKFKEKNIIKFNELNDELKLRSIKCVCGKTITLDKYNKHQDQCKTIKNKIDESLKKKVINIKNDKIAVNRETFNCTICSEKNLDRKGLLKHINTKHLKNDYGVCPICLCQPWGDPNYKTHLRGHINLRHQFDYDTTVDYNNSEDAILQEILKKSKEDY